MISTIESYKWAAFIFVCLLFIDTDECVLEQPEGTRVPKPDRRVSVCTLHRASKRGRERELQKSCEALEDCYPDVVSMQEFQNYLELKEKMAWFGGYRAKNCGIRRFLTSTSTSCLLYSVCNRIF